MQNPEKETNPVDDLREYVLTQVEIARLQTVQGVARVSAKLMAGLVLLLVATITFSVLTVAAGLWLGGLFQSTTKGFLVLGGAYALLLVIFIAFSEQLIKKPFRNRIINSLLHNQNHG